jgi:hypothetical protein
VTHSQLRESSTADVVRLAKWLGLEYGRRENEPFPVYRRRVILTVWAATKRGMWVEP